MGTEEFSLAQLLIVALASAALGSGATWMIMKNRWPKRSSLAVSATTREKDDINAWARLHELNGSHQPARLVHLTVRREIGGRTSMPAMLLVGGGTNDLVPFKRKRERADGKGRAFYLKFENVVTLDRQMLISASEDEGAMIVFLARLGVPKEQPFLPDVDREQYKQYLPEELRVAVAQVLASDATRALSARDLQVAVAAARAKQGEAGR